MEISGTAYFGVQKERCTKYYLDRYLVRYFQGVILRFFEQTLSAFTRFQRFCSDLVRLSHTFQTSKTSETSETLWDEVDDAAGVKADKAAGASVSEKVSKSLKSFKRSREDQKNLWSLMKSDSSKNLKISGLPLALPTWAAAQMVCFLKHFNVHTTLLPAGLH